MKGRFRALGLPIPVSQDLEALVLRWEANSGPKWTVDRLKSLKQDFIRLRTGLEPLTYVRKNRSGRWFGVLGFLRRFSLQHLRGFEIVLNCMMVYSSYIPSEPTRGHIASMRASVQSIPPFIPEKLHEDLAKHARDVVGFRKVGPGQPLLTFRGKVATKSPVWGGPSVSQGDYLEAEFLWLKDPYHKIFLNRHYRVYKPVLEGIDNASLWEPLPGLSGQSHHMLDFGPFETIHSRLRPPFFAVDAGTITPLTKDGGWKVRWIANPYRIHQLALQPLGSTLFGVLAELPWDCTFEQSKPYVVIQEHLKRGGKCFAVDLQSATDFFPLSLQLTVLRAVFGQIPDIELFEELSRSDWYWRTGKDSLSFRWTNGQPMGLYPSFPSFSLTHGLLLDFLAGGVPNRFFILGDDVVILHQPTYLAYMQVLKLLGCPHNVAKSLNSRTLTEFAGKIITPELVISAYKWRDINSNNFLELMRTFGQRFRPLLRARERRVYDAVKRYLPPHGCNHSEGLAEPLEDVVFKTECFESGMPEARGRVCHTSFFHRLAEFLHPDRPDSLFHKVCWKWFTKQSEHLAERVLMAFETTPFRNFPGDGGVLADVLEVINKNVELPATGPTEGIGHQSTLVFYERILGFSEKARKPE
jgi:hypothetical protein